MDKILEYEIIEEVSTSQDTEIYRAKDASHQKVILKLLSDEQIDAEKLARFRKEYEITTKLSSEWIVRPHHLIKYEDTYVMVLEDFGGISLKQFIVKNSPCNDQQQLIDLLQVALLITKALNDIHNQQIIHKDINPTNIIYNKDSGILKIIDFGLATELKNEHFEPTDESRFEGTYAYISPEQTGRFNRIIDYRTDFYSLGITLYELFSGSLPFNAISPREWIHCHMAKEPVALNKLNANIPEEISDIVMKLINKTAENRYQSGYGIIRDLEKCINDITRYGKITNFNLGKYDVPQKFQLPQKLYGRDAEINTLLSFYQNLQKSESALILVNGYSGIGKTSIIQEIQRPVIESKGYFASGKFDTLKRNIPYHAFLQALSKLIKSILSESEEEIENWKQRLLNNLNGNGRLVTDIIPELTLVIGEQPELPTLPPSESQNRFFNTFRNLINTFTSHEHTLVLFLDDLHWADMASLDMIENLLMDQQQGALLLIGAYRDNEVSSDHPLAQSINTIKEANITCLDMHIHALEEPAVQELFIDLFSLDAETAGSLARLSITKTNGNPFYIIEFLKSLYQHHLLYFHAETGKWMLALDKIQKSDVAENVAESISRNIKGLPQENLYLLKYAACIGSTFDAALVHEATNKPWEVVISELNKSAEESLIYPLSGQYRFAEYNSAIRVTYKFVHDRVQQEIYACISADEKMAIHREIGQILLNKSTQTAQDDLLYVVLGHFNKGLDLLQPEEKIHITQLNLQACQRSKKAGAFDHALFYANVCARLIDTSYWETHYDLVLQIQRERAEALMLVGEYVEMDKSLNESLKFIKHVVDQVQFLSIRVQSFIAQHRQPDAVNEALGILKLLHVHFPKKPKTYHILINFIKISVRLKKIKSADDIRLPEMTNPNMLAAMNLMATILSASYYVNPNLFPLIVFKLIQYTLTYGIAPKSPVAFITLGLIEWSLSRPEKGYLHGRIGMKMIEKLNASEHWSQAACIYYSGVMWNEPLKNVITGLFDAYKTGMDTGDNEFAVASAAAGLCYKFYAGRDIRDLFAETKKYSNTLGHLNQKVPFNQIKGLQQTINRFIEETNDPEVLKGTFYNEHEMLPHFKEVEDNASALDLYLKKMVVAYHFNRFSQAKEITDQARGIVKDVAGLFLYALFYYYESLILLANIDNFNKNKTKWAWKRINGNLKKFKKWTKYCPSNFENKYRLLQAEIEKYSGDKNLASDLYDQAIQCSQKEGNLLDQALSNERAGLFWLMHDKKEFAQLYLSKAHKMYSIWGANAKANTIKNEYKEFIIPVENPGAGLINKTVTKSSTGASKAIQAFDLEAIIEAAKAISSEIIYTDLIKKILTIILEHAGAQKGVLLIKEGDTALNIAAIGYVEKNEIKVESDSKAITGDFLPRSIIYYTERIKEAVILHNASSVGDFIQDEYIRKHHVKSVISIPILHQSKFSGTLYLENNLSTHVFNQKRVDILTILCTQAAISLENAMLYNSLEQKVNERTKEITEKNALLQDQKKKTEQAYDQLKELNATKDKFFSILAHDLRGPIGNINQFFDVLTNDEVIYDSEEFEQFIGEFKKTSKNTYELLNNLLIWAQSQQDELVFNPRLSSLNKLVEANLSLIEQKAQTKGVSLTNQSNDEAAAYFDVNLIDTVMRNLINNALKYTSKGDSIVVSIETNESFAIVSVQDTGIGMTESIKNNLFNIQNKTTSKRGTDGEIGTGLGLILCKEFVEKNGGDIWVESKINEGSTFRFSVPLNK